ncbi:MetS family NSS transporter small subunit [candidate division KSB1 bacterium]
MELGTIIMMIIILSFTWGGFLYCIILAWKKEQSKKSA